MDLGFTAGQSGFQAEALVWGLDGTPIKGISPFNNAVAAAVKSDGRIRRAARGGVPIPTWAASSLSTRPALGDPETAGADPIYVLRVVDVALRDLTVESLLDDTVILRGAPR